MREFKRYIAERLVGERLKFSCNCAIPINAVGRIVDYEIINNEILFSVDMNGRVIQIGENHPNMEVEKV